MSNVYKMGMNRKREEIYNHMRRELELTHEIIDDFLKITIQEFVRDNGYEDEIDRKLLYKFGKRILHKVTKGIKLELGEFGKNIFVGILHNWLKMGLEKELSLRIKSVELEESGNLNKNEVKDKEKQTKKDEKITDNHSDKNKDDLMFR